MRFIMSLCFSFVVVLSYCPTGLVAAECDEPEAPENVRIYFANGMSNEERDVIKSKEKLKGELGVNDAVMGYSYNDNEFWLDQLLQVYQQRENESEEFWNWMQNMEQAPQWFQEEYAESVGRFEDDVVRTDPDLYGHIRKYVADLRSGKKVVIVAHSQGNFYANNAYRHIYINYPQYRNSIGIVAVATPSDKVQDGGPYTNNPEDLIINSVRYFYPDTLAANVPAYDNPGSWIDHEFVETYLKGYAGRIVGQINQRIASLESPAIDFECKDPDDVPVSVLTNYASNISSTSARLHGVVQSGKQIGLICIRRKAEHGYPPSCWSYRESLPVSGWGDTGESFHCTANNLSPNTTYRFRVCGRRGDAISNGGVVSFKTNISCGTPLNADGGSEGLSVNFGMGASAGYAQVEFEAYTIPDMLEIWHGGRKIYTTGGYVSDLHSSNVYHNPTYGQEWEVRVLGNSDAGTAWNLIISCPQ